MEYININKNRIMGSASSIINNDIYISYEKSNQNIEIFKNNLQCLNYSILDSSLLLNRDNTISIQELKYQMMILLEKTQFIFICINQNFFSSYTQNLEYNEIKNFQNKHKIIYLIIDNCFTPNNNNIVKMFIGSEKWYPLYDDESIKSSTDSIKTFISSNK